MSHDGYQYSDWKDWSPKDYLQTYFSRIEEEEEIVLSYLVKALEDIQQNFDTALHYGVGPSIAEIIPLTPYVKEIYLSEYLVANILELRKWLNGESDAFDWSLFVNKCIELEEGKFGMDANARTEEIRGRIADIFIGNAEYFPAFRGNPTQFPLVVSTFCAESATADKHTWRRYTQNIIQHVQKDGYLLITALHDTDGYKVGNAFFPSARVKAVDYFDLLLSQGYNKSNIEIIISKVRHSKEVGFNQIMTITAKK